MLANILSQFGSVGAKEFGILASIIVMDAALSGDNSIAISAMTKHLAENLRQKAVYIGMMLAALFRFVALFFTAFIISNPWVQILGAFYLIWLCVSHFRTEEDESEGFHHKQKGFIGTLIAVGFLDLSLSLDNVVAITSMTNNLTVIFIGVGISIAMLAVATKITNWMMKKFPTIQDAAYIILAFLGVNMLLKDGGEFMIWAGNLINKYHSTFEHAKLDIGEIGEIIGVAIILVFALLKDVLFKSEENNNVTVEKAIEAE